MGEWSKKILSEFSRRQSETKNFVESSSALRRSWAETEIPTKWELLKETLQEEIDAVSKVCPGRFSMQVLSNEAVKLVGNQGEIEVFLRLKRGCFDDEDFGIIEFSMRKTARYTHEQLSYTNHLKFVMVGKRAMLTAGPGLTRNQHWSEMFPDIDGWIRIPRAAEFFLTLLESW